jgi:hypothetical protein
MMPPSYGNMKNSNDETRRDIFKKKHQDLHKNGEKWMKETTNNCIPVVVATLIATVVFAAAFTISRLVNDLSRAELVQWTEQCRARFQPELNQAELEQAHEPLG